MSSTERELVRRLHEQLLKFSTGQGHMVLWNTREHLGVCNQVRPKHGVCSPLCAAYRQVMDDSADYLLEHPEQPAQISLFDDGRERETA